MDIVKIAAICIVSTVICRLFDRNSREYALYIKIAAAAVVLSFLFIYISPLIESIQVIFEHSESDEDYLKILFKATGICYISQFAADICKDSGENLLASQAELAGRVGLMVSAIPLFEQAVDIIISFSRT